MVWSLAIAGVALIAGALLAAGQSRRIVKYQRRELDLAAHRVADAIAQRFGRLQYGLRGAPGAVAAVGDEVLTRRAFRAYSETPDVAVQFSGALGFGFIRRVPAMDEADFVARVRGDGEPGFAIHQLAPHEGERWVIQYIEPVERNTPSLGLDIASEPMRRAAALTAMTTGGVALTAPIELVQYRGSQHGFLVLLPVYRLGAPLATAAQRERAAIGWSYAPIVADHVLATVDEARGLAVTLADVTGPGPAIAFHTETAASAGLTAVEQRDVMGRRWQIEVARSDADVSPLVAPGPMFGIGGAAGALLAAFAAIVATSRARRRDTALARARLATIVDSSPDAIIGQELDGRIALWNAAAERLFGYRSDEVLGRPVAELLLPDDRLDEDAALRQRVMRDGQAPAFDTRRRHRDSHVLEVSVTGAAIRDDDGTVIGTAKLIRDISERKQHERALGELHAALEQRVAERTAELERAHRDLRTVLDAMPSMIGYWDRQLVNRFANREYAQWFQADPQKIRGMTMPALLGEALFERNRPYVEAALRGEPQTFERTLRHASGRERHTLAQYLPDVTDGQVLGFYVLVHDVSALTESRLELAGALREHRALLGAITEHVLFSITDAAGKILDVNDNFCRLSGYTREELIGQDHRIINSGNHPAELWRDLWSTIRAGKPWRGELCNRSKTGELYWVENVIGPRIGADGQVQGHFSLQSDITDRRRAEATLRSHERQMKLVIDAFPGRLAYWDRDLRCTFAGGAMSPAPPVGDALRFEADEISGGLSKAELQALWQGETQHRERSIGQAMGATRHYLVHYVPDRDGEHVRGFVAAATDVTQLKETQRVLEDRTREAERASVAKGEFLANVSHEIRTPLNAIVGMHYLLAATRLDDEQRDMMYKAELAGRALLGIVDNVLDLAKIEAGEIALASEIFSLAELLHEVEAVFQPDARVRRLALSVELADDLPARLVGDPDRIRQMVSNLVGNAFKFTEHGAIQIRATVQDRADGLVRVRIAVSDSGIGIPADVLPRLFSPFVQADASTSRRYGGTGLGLSIVRHIAELMGGEVDVRSEVGTGSEFYIIIPLLLGDRGDLAVDPAQLEIMVIDDHIPDAMSISAIGRSLGWRVTTVLSGHESLAVIDERVRTGAALPDAFVVDWQMPEMDGLALIERLATQLGDRMPTALMVSIYDSARLVVRAARVTPDAVLEKPVSVSTLFNAVNDGIARHRGHTGDVTRGTRFRDRTTRWLPGVRVLVVDDNGINLEVARGVLQQAGARVEICDSGEAALELLRRRGPELDAVLMDVQMTGIDGLATTRRLRDELGLTELPVIALTAGALVEERRRALAAGMNDFLSKPFDPATLVRVVRRWVEAARQSTVPAKGRTATLPVLAAAAAWPVPPIDGIDAGGIAASLGLSPASYLGLMRGLLREFADLAVLPPAPVSPAGHAALAARAHRLAGGAGQLGAVAVRDAAIALELALREGSEALPPQTLLGAVARALSALSSACTRALAAVDAAASPASPVASPDEPGLTADQRGELLRLLEQRNLEALDRVEAARPALQRTLGPQFVRFVRAMDDLDFVAAHQILQGALA